VNTKIHLPTWELRSWHCCRGVKWSRHC